MGSPLALVEQDSHGAPTAFPRSWGTSSIRKSPRRSTSLNGSPTPRPASREGRRHESQREERLTRQEGLAWSSSNGCPVMVTGFRSSSYGPRRRRSAAGRWALARQLSWL